MKYLFVLCCVLLSASEPKAADTDLKNELVLRARPPVWHFDKSGISQQIELTMRYWGDIKGENFGFEEWGDSKIVKEFHYKLRNFENKLPEGRHTLGPLELNFAGKDYVSNQLEVQVLPPIDSFRGTRAYIIPSECVTDDRVGLVIYQYRKRERELYDLDFRPDIPFKVFGHGGNTSSTTDSNGDKLWYRMRYFTLIFPKAGNYTITEDLLQDSPRNLTFSASITVKAKE